MKQYLIRLSLLHRDEVYFWISSDTNIGYLQQTYPDLMAITIMEVRDGL
jgi:hypothetical protein